jgi:hypothetical protein
MIETFFRKIKAGELPSPEYRLARAKAWRKWFAAVGGTPFTMNDDKPDLFADLDA